MHLCIYAKKGRCLPSEGSWRTSAISNPSISKWKIWDWRSTIGVTLPADVEVCPLRYGASGRDCGGIGTQEVSLVERRAVLDTAENDEKDEDDGAGDEDEGRRAQYGTYAKGVSYSIRLAIVVLPRRHSRIPAAIADVCELYYDRMGILRPEGWDSTRSCPIAVLSASFAWALLKQRARTSKRTLTLTLTATTMIPWRDIRLGALFRLSR